MRGPSARVCRDSVDIYAALPSPVAGTSGGPVYKFASSPTYSGVRCTAQPIGLVEIVDAQNRVTMQAEWELMFSSPQSVSLRDKIIYVDNVGITHTMFVETKRDNASRGGAFTIRALEKV